MIEGQSATITLDQLCVGLYVTLDLGWTDHPFLFSSFKIRNRDQLVALKSLKLARLSYVQSKSDARPLQSAEAALAPVPAPAEVKQAMEELWKDKHERIAQHSSFRVAVSRSEKHYLRTTESAKQVMRDLFTKPAEAFARAQATVDDVVRYFLADQNLVVRLLGDEVASDNAQRHNVNVVVLSLMLARAAGLDEQSMRLLGLGALFHDLGMGKVASKITGKTEPLTTAERHYYELHPLYGVEMSKQIPDLAPEALDIIRHHHESADGSGYPEHLSGEAIAPLTRIVAIADAYDLCCNPQVPAKAFAPAEAMTHLYKRDRHRFDNPLLQQFIRCMGVYPPGTLVVLSSGAVGIVVSVNSDALLQPAVLLYDPKIPRADAVIFDLRENAEVKIVRAVRANVLPRQAVEYLNPPRRVSYFVDEAGRRVG